MCHASGGNCRNPAGKKTHQKTHKETSYRNSRQYSLVSFSSPPKQIVHRIILEPFLKKKVLKRFLFGLVDNNGHIRRITLQPTQVLEKCGREQGMCSSGYCVYLFGSKETRGVYHNHQVMTRQKVS